MTALRDESGNIVSDRPIRDGADLIARVGELEALMNILMGKLDHLNFHVVYDTYWEYMQKSRDLRLDAQVFTMTSGADGLRQPSIGARSGVQGDVILAAPPDETEDES